LLKLLAKIDRAVLMVFLQDPLALLNQ